MSVCIRRSSSRGVKYTKYHVSQQSHLLTVVAKTQLNMTIPEEFDIIVCGGGSCGSVNPSLSSHTPLTSLNRCVVAGRLANLDHNLQVLLIEGGETNLNVGARSIYPKLINTDSYRTHGETTCTHLNASYLIMLQGLPTRNLPEEHEARQ